MHNLNEASKCQKEEINVNPTKEKSSVENNDFTDLKISNKDSKKKSKLEGFIQKKH